MDEKSFCPWIKMTHMDLLFDFLTAVAKYQDSWK